MDSQALPPPTETQPLLQALSSVLSDISEFLANCIPSHYTTKCGPIFSHATIGAHVRHCIDHLAAFNAALESTCNTCLAKSQASPIVDYETRHRGTPVEIDPRIALAEISRHAQVLRAINTAGGQQTVRICVLSDPFSPAQLVDSTLIREMAYLLSHTIHHQATIRSMATYLGMNLSSTFGVAPSTQLHAHVVEQVLHSQQPSLMSQLQVTPEAQACAH